MAAAASRATDPEWQVTVPELRRVRRSRGSGRLRTGASGGGRQPPARERVAAATGVAGGVRVWKIGADDPRRVVHGVKVGLALSLIAMFY
uniref:Uncharacterized protein n=1 Tax=Oryza sativa subsp. japonica TaxID=39947 RepID=Q6K2L6_ORYSJ|nr:hypothetical protein [Oryza sativa Japonica Group]BAD22456.1 hypothetical protein [Oryza sativa Japonica Group]